MATVIFGIGLLVFLALLFTAFFERTRIPDVLALILLGILLGPVTGLIRPEDLGRVGNVMSTVALIIILFESGTALEADVLLKAFAPTLSLSLITFGATMGIVYLIAHFLLDVTPLMGWILASTLGAVSAAVVIPMAKTLKMREPAATVVVIESSLGDVLSIVLVFGLVESAVTGTGAAVEAGRIAGSIISSLMMAALIGLLGGIGWLVVLNSVRRFPNTAFATIAYVFVLYGIAEFLHYSGAIAALAFGLTLTNHEHLPLHRFEVFQRRELGALTEADVIFHGEIIFLLKTFFFTYLGVSIQFSDVRNALIAVLLVAATYLARAVIVRFTMRKISPGWEESSLMAVMVPKGLTAAVLAGIPLEQGMPGAELVQSFSYMVVLVSIIATAALIPAMRHRRLASLCRKAFPQTE